MIPADRRLALALAGSALLHLAVLSTLRTPAMPPAPPAGSTLNLLLIPVPRWSLPSSAQLPQAAPAPALRPLGKLLGTPAEPQGAPPGIEVPTRRGNSVTLGPVTAQAQRPSRLADAADYLDPSQLTRYPQLVAPFAAQYPRRALEEGRRSRLILQLMIDERGRVVEAQVALGDPESEFAAAALAAAREARFTPAEAGGRPVKARAYFSVSFVLE